MVEGGGLENRCRVKPTVGSNPTSSASTNSKGSGGVFLIWRPSGGVGIRKAQARGFVNTKPNLPSPGRPVQQISYIKATLYVALIVTK